MDSIRRDKTCRIGGRLTSQYKHSANFLGDGIIVNKLSHWRCKTWHKVAHGWSKVWKKSPFVNRRRVFFPRRASVVMFFLRSLNFAWTALSGFQSTGSIFLFFCPLFLPGPPFQVFIPPGRSLLPKSPFQVFNLASFVVFYVFLDCDCILLKEEVLSIALSRVSLSECNRSRRMLMYFSPTHEFKKSVFVVHTFQKDVKSFVFWKFLF